jgi:cation diffusion facilitator CzcD-associated flavoprotein CzcO
VVIVGGGISDFTLADCLQHANIDFAVLESGEKIGLIREQVWALGRVVPAS